MKKLLIIDSNALIHRAFHALPALTDSKGRQVQAVFGFLSVLIKVVSETNPDYLVATFDLPGPTFRDELYEEYKAKRVKAPQELYDQIPLIKDFLKAAGIPIFEEKQFEADDLIGTIAKQTEKNKDLQNIIVTGDLDTLQLIEGKRVVVYTLRRGMTDTVFYDEKAVKNRYGLQPGQLTDYKGLRGDPSDNIPGVAGVGEKTATELLKKHKTIEGVYKNLNKLPAVLQNKLKENKEEALFSRELAEIRKDAPLKFSLKKAEFSGWPREELKSLFDQYGFRSLWRRIQEPGSGSEPGLGPTGRKEELLKAVEEAKNHNLLSAEIYELEKKLIPVILEMEKTGILIDRFHLEKVSRKLDRGIQAVEKKVWKFAGKKFNVASSQQLSQILFEKLKLPTKGLKKTPGGAVSTAAPELAKLRGEHHIIVLVENYRELAKIKSTYTDSLVNLINPDTGRLHTTFHPLGTSTGRISSSDPNLQNIPVRGKWGKEIRNSFMSDADYSLLSVDYSQIELRVAAHLADDKKMIEAFRRGEDIHAATARFIFKVPQGKVKPDMRRVAKTINFGVLYGMSAQGFSERIGVSREEANRFIDKYFKEFKGVRRYMEKTKELVKKRQYVETLFGRRRYIPDINSRDWQARQAAERMAINMPIQGSATGDIIKKAMVRLDEEIKRRAWRGGVRILLQVHDELVLEVSDDIIKKAEPLVRGILENIVKLRVPLEVSIGRGKRWGEIDK